MSEAKLDRILASLSKLESDVSTLKSDVSTLKSDVSTLKSDVSTLSGRQDEMLKAFRANWSEMSALYRGSREDLKTFEDRIEGKLTQLAQRIQGLQETLEAQDFHSRELARRVTHLEGGREPPM